MQSLKEIFGEPARPPESFARAIGPARRIALAERIGPGAARASTVPAAPPPHHDLPQSAPPSGRGA
jgi:hypothetical protein